VLIEQLRASETRFSVVDVTRTKVAQSRARLALARSQLPGAEANLAASVANYLRIIGHRPGTLRFPQLSKVTPKSLDAALAMSERINPTILAVAFDEEAATHNIDLVAGELLPELSLNAQYSFNFIGNGGALNAGGGSKDTWNDTATIFGQVTMPLYEGGLTYSRVREAKQLASQKRLQVLDVRRQVREQVTNAWNIVKAAEAVIVSTRTQVQANQLALEGVRQESLVGSRTTLDVLDAETDLVESQVLLATAERDRIVAAYQLIAAVGRMTARSLGLGVAYYDVEQNYIDTRWKFIGTGVNTVD